MAEGHFESLSHTLPMEKLGEISWNNFSLMFFGREGSEIIPFAESFTHSHLNDRKDFASIFAEPR